jgi:flagellar protein FliS
MPYNIRDSYLENRILGASPLELVAILYQEASKSVREAIRQLETGDIRARSRAVTRAQLILMELVNSLDLEAGGFIARNLAELYDYMQRRLTEANAAQSRAQLEEVARLLGILEEGWKHCAAADTDLASERRPAAEVVHAF